MINTTLDNLIACINQVSDLRQPNQPIAYLNSELFQFHAILQEHGDRFIERGLSPEFLQLGQAIAHELAEREGVWHSYRYNIPDDFKEWKECLHQSQHLKRILIAELRLAWRDHPDQRRHLKPSRGRNSIENFMSHWGQLIYLVDTNDAQIHFSPYLQQIAQQSQEVRARLIQLYGIQTQNAHNFNHLKDLRNQAAQFGQMYLSIIREYARTIFLLEPEILDLFASPYTKFRHRHRSHHPHKLQPQNRAISA